MLFICHSIFGLVVRFYVTHSVKYCIYKIIHKAASASKNAVIGHATISINQIDSTQFRKNNNCKMVPGELGKNGILTCM